MDGKNKKREDRRESINTTRVKERKVQVSAIREGKKGEKEWATKGRKRKAKERKKENKDRNKVKIHLFYDM